MDFQSLLSNNEYVDYSLWSEYSSGCTSGNVPSSPSSTTSVSSSSLLGDDNSMYDLSALVGSHLTSLGDGGVHHSSLCSSSADVTSSESNDSVNNVFSHWMDLQQTDQYQNETLQTVMLNPYQDGGDENTAEWCSANKLTSRFDFSQPLPTGCASQCSKPKRKRVQSKTQRKEANVRERKRMVYLNDAFENLRKILPAFSYEKNLSRIETLKLAIKYIGFMKDVTTSDNK
ncbi:pancreas transcription factor 1 subunit alpha-like [Gigantopelta aegis]|uniref:pancreas transcription factor 1 subunit alpha-like n=1 Tax=Gigantopelta aegis TaxID=1735272 RepID=UPI001B88CF7B|nr:pancreas transcription factor 1 subunit alpha-like [Gigantopelta aegis]